MPQEIQKILDHLRNPNDGYTQKSIGLLVKKLIVNNLGSNYANNVPPGQVIHFFDPPANGAPHKPTAIDSTGFAALQKSIKEAIDNKKAKRFYVPLGLSYGKENETDSRNHLVSLIIDIDTQGKPSYLYINPLGDIKKYREDAEVYLRHLMHGVGQELKSDEILRMEKPIQKDVKYCGDYNGFLLNLAATLHGKPLKAVAQALHVIPEDIIPSNVKLREQHIKEIVALQNPPQSLTRQQAAVANNHASTMTTNIQLPRSSNNSGNTLTYAHYSKFIGNLSDTLLGNNGNILLGALPDGKKGFKAYCSDSTKIKSFEFEQKLQGNKANNITSLVLGDNLSNEEKIKIAKSIVALNCMGIDKKPPLAGASVLLQGINDPEFKKILKVEFKKAGVKSFNSICSPQSQQMPCNPKVNTPEQKQDDKPEMRSPRSGG